ncbi:MAG: hypothetical protein VB140_05895 [Burkholderia sp.]
MSSTAAVPNASHAMRPLLYAYCPSIPRGVLLIGHGYARCGVVNILVDARDDVRMERKTVATGVVA